MKKSINRFLSILLVLLMAMNGAGTHAFAEGGLTEGGVAQEQTVSVSGQEEESSDGDRREPAQPAGQTSADGQQQDGTAQPTDNSTDGGQEDGEIPPAELFSGGDSQDGGDNQPADNPPDGGQPDDGGQPADPVFTGGQQEGEDQALDGLSADDPINGSEDQPADEPQPADEQAAFEPAPFRYQTAIGAVSFTVTADPGMFASEADFVLAAASDENGEIRAAAEAALGVSGDAGALVSHRLYRFFGSDMYGEAQVKLEKTGFTELAAQYPEGELSVYLLRWNSAERKAFRVSAAVDQGQNSLSFSLLSPGVFDLVTVMRLPLTGDQPAADEAGNEQPEEAGADAAENNEYSVGSSSVQACSVYRVAADVRPVESGTVSGAGSYAEGMDVVLTVYPAKDYTLYGLTVTYTDGSGQSRQAPVTQGTDENADRWTFTMPPADVSVTATFLPLCTLTYWTTIPYATAPEYSGGSFAFGSIVTVADNCFDFPSRYRFLGWNTQRGGEGDAYKPGDAFSIIANTDLYTVWKLVPSADDFSMSFPDGLEYSGHAKPAAVTGQLGMGAITVHYYRDGIELPAGQVIGIGTYTVKADVEESRTYMAGTGIEIGTFTITAQAVTITAADQTVAVDCSISTGADKYSVTSGTLLEGHEIASVTLTSTSTEAITDSGAITPGEASIRDADGNDVTAIYDIAYASGTLTVGYPVFFSPGEDGTGEMAPTAVKADGEYVLPECGFTGPVGCHSKQWSVRSSGYASVLKAPGDTVTIKNDTYVTAIWEKNTYTVHFDGNGNAGGGTADQSFVFGTARALTPNGFIAPEGAIGFGGWNTVASPTAGNPGVFYADGQTVSDLTAENGGTVTLYAQWFTGTLEQLKSNITVMDGAVLSGTLGANVKISIADGATVTLNGVTISGVNDESCPWAGITCLGSAAIILAENTTNTVQGFFQNNPGIQAGPDGSTLTIQGKGRLIASSSGQAPGIGCGSRAACGNIRIEGGDINATGGTRSAGIGSRDMRCGNITITGGKVTAAGGDYAAGIGSGIMGGCGAITISGGEVSAAGGDYGAGIGSGRNGSCGDITITADIVKLTAAKGANAAYSVGAGSGGSCGSVTISGMQGAIEESPYSIWSYTVVFYGNSQDTLGEMDVQTLIYGIPASLNRCGFDRLGYFFSGWNTQPDGSASPAYADREAVTALTETEGGTVTLYAQWTANQYTVIYDGNGATGGKTERQTFTYGEPQRLTANGFTYPGYAFTGWNAKPDGSGHSFTDGQEVSSLTAVKDGELVFYAQWTLDADHFSGTGTLEDPYLIKTGTGWNVFCDLLASGKTFSEQSVKLDRSISVSRMAGGTFNGSFDGQGNTLTVSLAPSSGDWAAPFHSVKNVHNLRVAGSINASSLSITHVGGIAISLSGTIYNCTCSAAITALDASILGGFVCSAAFPIVTNCVFDGRLSGSARQYGGFVASCSVTEGITRCLFAPASLSFTGREGGTFLNGNFYPENCCYTQALGDPQGTRVYAIAPGEGVSEISARTYWPSGVISHGGNVYAAPRQEVLLTLTPDIPAGKALNSYQASAGSLTYIPGLYTSIVMPDENVTVTATFVDGCAISFEANGGSGRMKADAVPRGDCFSLPACAFTAPEGRQFKAWRVRIGEAESVIKAPGDLIAITADTVATAVWTVTAPVVAEGVSTTFGDAFTLNFYTRLPVGVLNDPGAYGVFTSERGGKTILVSEAETREEGGLTLYRFSFSVAAKEAAMPVTLKLYDGNGAPLTIKNKAGDTDYTETGYTFSLSMYTDILAKGDYDEKTKALAAATRDYCEMAQICLNYKAEGLTSSARVTGLDAGALSKYTVTTLGNLPEGVAVEGLSVMFESDNSLRLYLTFACEGAEAGLTFKVDGENAVLHQRADGKEYLVASGIAAKRLDEPHTFQICKDGAEVYAYRASVLSYASILANGDYGNWRDMGKALYLYNQAAKSYFGAK